MHSLFSVFSVVWGRTSQSIHSWALAMGMTGVSSAPFTGSGGAEPRAGKLKIPNPLTSFEGLLWGLYSAETVMPLSFCLE